MEQSDFDLLCSPMSRNLGKMGFCHCDLWSNNMLKKGDAIIAIDFETASTGVKRVKWRLGMLYFPKWMDFQREM